MKYKKNGLGNGKLSGRWRWFGLDDEAISSGKNHSMSIEGDRGREIHCWIDQSIQVVETVLDAWSSLFYVSVITKIVLCSIKFLRISETIFLEKNL